MNAKGRVIAHATTPLVRQARIKPLPGYLLRTKAPPPYEKVLASTTNEIDR